MVPCHVHVLVSIFTKARRLILLVLVLRLCWLSITSNTRGRSLQPYPFLSIILLTVNDIELNKLYNVAVWFVCSKYFS